MKYIVCAYGNFPNQDSALCDTLKSSTYIVGKDVEIPEVLKNVSVGDVLLLRVDQKIVAYGKVHKPFEAHPRSDGHWKNRFFVEKWFVLDSINPRNGIPIEGVKDVSSSEQIAKEVSPEWFQERFKEFQNRKISFRESLKRFWRGFIKFRGTATKSEFWYATLFCFIVGIVFLAAAEIVGYKSESAARDAVAKVDAKYVEEVKKYRQTFQTKMENLKRKTANISYAPASIREEIAKLESEVERASERCEEIINHKFDYTGLRFYWTEYREYFDIWGLNCCGENSFRELDEWCSECEDAAYECLSGYVRILGFIFKLDILVGISLLVPLLALCVRRLRGRELFPRAIFAAVPVALIASFFVCLAVMFVSSPLGVGVFTIIDGASFCFILGALLPVFTAVFIPVSAYVFHNAEKVMALLKNSSRESSDDACCDERSECDENTAEPIQVKNGKMSFGKAISRFWKGYFKFNGRAKRSELWFAILLDAVVLGTISLCIANYVPLAEICDGDASVTGSVVAFFLVVGNLWSLATVFPFLALYVRRFHDTDRSAWNLLWLLIALPVSIALFPIGVEMFSCAEYGKGVLLFILGVGLGVPALYKLAVLLFAGSTKGRNRFGNPNTAEPIQVKNGKMSFGKAISRFWKGYFKFSGRAKRSELWFAILLDAVVLGTISLCIANYVPLAEICDGDASVTGNVVAFFLMVGNLWSLATVFPFLALYVRRFHDTNRSAWNLLWLLFALPVSIALLFMGVGMLPSFDTFWETFYEALVGMLLFREECVIGVLLLILGVGLGVPALYKLAVLLFAGSTKGRNRFGNPE